MSGNDFEEKNLVDILKKDVEVKYTNLISADEKLAKAESKLKGDLIKDEKDAIIKLNEALNALQRATIKSKNETKNIKTFVDSMTEKIKKLTKIINPEEKDESKVLEGGSISTNNSIRRQIFTDLKYITKYLKYKTKYIVFKSKHQFN